MISKYAHEGHKRYASLMPGEALEACLKSIIASIGCPAASISRADIFDLLATGDYPSAAHIVPPLRRARATRNGGRFF